MFHLVKALGLEKYSVMGHSRGILIALIMSLLDSQKVKCLVMLDALGPPSTYAEKTILFLKKALENYLSYSSRPKTRYPNIDSAIKERMEASRISYESAKALVERGTIKIDQSYAWTYDRRLFSMPASFPQNDYVDALLRGIRVPVCLIKGAQGLKYPRALFDHRKKLIKNLDMHEIQGGHHLHMDNPKPAAVILNRFFLKYH